MTSAAAPQASNTLPAATGAGQSHTPAHITHPASPPSKRDLKSWWKGFKLPSKHQDTHGTHPFTTSHSTRSVFDESQFQDVNNPALLQEFLDVQDAIALRRTQHETESGAIPAQAPPAPSTAEKLYTSVSLKLRTLCCTGVHLTKQKTTEPRAHGIFGVPLRQSITYANVAISLVDENGKSYIYGYVPIVVAKCGVFLKEKGGPSLNISSPGLDY